VSVRIRTMGHSNRTAEEFLSLVRTARIELVADVRRFPSSRVFPHFNRPALAASLASAGIGYRWFEALGGRRGEGRQGREESGSDNDSPNIGIADPSFRLYADHMATPAFARALEELIALARERPTAILCAERDFRRCHRRYLADALHAHGVEVEHLQDGGKSEMHVLTPGAAVIAGGVVTYPEPDLPRLF